MRLFNLIRTEDASGVSGTGVVAQGVVFDSGEVAMTWLTRYKSTAVYPSLDELIAIHGHEGRTVVEFLPMLPVTIETARFVIKPPSDDRLYIPGTPIPGVLYEVHAVDQQGNTEKIRWVTRASFVVEGRGDSRMILEFAE